MPIAPIVEVAFQSLPSAASPVWTDITRYVRHEQRIDIRWGARSELEQIQASTLALTLENSDARFTAGNSGSPYYPNVRKNRRIRVRLVHVVSNYALNPSFETNADEWAGNGTPTPSIAQSATRAHHGTKSGLVTWGTGGTVDVRTTLYGLDRGKAYTATAWVWVAAGGSPAVRLGVDGIGTGTASSTTGAWQQITYTFTATEVRHTLTLSPATAATSGHQVWLDEVMVAEGSTATTFDATAPLISPRYNGFVNEWPVEWPNGGKVALTRITATDVYKGLDRTDVASFLEEEVLLDQPAAYYPLSEPSGSASAGDLSGGAGGSLVATTVIGGEAQFGSGTGPAADGLTCVKFVPNSATEGTYLAADVGTDFESASSSNFINVEAWFSTSVVSRTLLGLRSEDSTYQMEISLNGSGAVQIAFTFRDTDTGVVSSVTRTWVTGNLANDATHHLVYNEATGVVWIDGVSTGSQSIEPMYRLRRLHVGAYQGTSMWDGSIAHVAVYANGSLSSTRIAAHNTAGTTGFSGETADDRVTRICGYAGIDAGDLTIEGTLFDAIATQGAGNKTALALLREVADTESAKLFSEKDQGIRYQARDVRYNRDVTLTLAAADLEPLRFNDNDQQLINRVDGQRPGGAKIRIENTDSQQNYGLYKRPLNVLKTSDADVVDAAQWLVQRFADPAPRLVELPVEGSTLDTTTYRALLAMEVSSLLGITSLPSQAPASSLSVSVEGCAELIGPADHHFAFYTSPAELDDVWQLDDATYSVLGTSTRLAY